MTDNSYRKYVKNPITTTSLDGALVTQINTAITDISNLQSSLAFETTTRTNADNNLQNQITTNTNAISTEIADRMNADNNMQSQITANTNAIATETTDRTNADNNLQSQITTNTNAISTETTNRTNADTNLQNQITTNANDISTETTNRTNADTNLQNQINAINPDFTNVPRVYGASGLLSNIKMYGAFGTTSGTFREFVTSLVPAAFSTVICAVIVAVYNNVNGVADVKFTAFQTLSTTQITGRAIESNRHDNATTDEGLERGDFEGSEVYFLVFGT